MSSFHTEIVSVLHIPVKEISIHSHVPPMTHILLEQKQALGCLEKKIPQLPVLVCCKSTAPQGVHCVTEVFTSHRRQLLRSISGLSDVLHIMIEEWQGLKW